MVEIPTGNFTICIRISVKFHISILTLLRTRAGSLFVNVTGCLVMMKSYHRRKKRESGLNPEVSAICPGIVRHVNRFRLKKIRAA